MALSKDLTAQAPPYEWWAVPGTGPAARKLFNDRMAEQMDRLKRVPSTGHILFQIPLSAERMTRPSGRAFDPGDE